MVFAVPVVKRAQIDSLCSQGLEHASTDRHSKRGAHARALGAWLHGMGSSPKRAEALFLFEFFLVDGSFARCALLRSNAAA